MCRYRRFFLALIIVGSMLAGCGLFSSKVQVGWVETSVPGRFEASFKQFSGAEVRQIRMESGEELVLAIQADVEKGSLLLRLVDPQGNFVWETNLDQEGTQSAAYTADRSGRYRLRIIAEDAAGNFAIEWDVK